MLLDVTDAAELPHELQSFTIPAGAAPNEVHDFSLGNMTYTIPLLVQAPA